jgi:hypothetical protein
MVVLADSHNQDLCGLESVPMTTVGRQTLLSGSEAPIRMRKRKWAIFLL